MSTLGTCNRCDNESPAVHAVRNPDTETWTVSCENCLNIETVDEDAPTMGGLTQQDVYEMLTHGYGVDVRYLTAEEWLKAVARYEHWMNPNVFGKTFAACLSVCEILDVKLPNVRRSSL